MDFETHITSMTRDGRRLEVSVGFDVHQQVYVNGESQGEIM